MKRWFFLLHYTKLIKILRAPWIHFTLLNNLFISILQWTITLWNLVSIILFRYVMFNSWCNGHSFWHVMHKSLQLVMFGHKMSLGTHFIIHMASHLSVVFECLTTIINCSCVCQNVRPYAILSSSLPYCCNHSHPLDSEKFFPSGLGGDRLGWNCSWMIFRNF